MKRMHRVWLSVLCALALVAGPDRAGAAAAKDIALNVLGVYESGIFNADSIVGSEVAAYDPATERLFITNVADNAIDIVSIANPASPSKVGTFGLDQWGASPNSVDSHDGLIVVAVQADPKTDPGMAVFFDAAGDSEADGFVAAVEVGALPDMVTFTPNGAMVLVANEGEPDFYGPGNSDPEGSVSIIDVSSPATMTDDDVITVGFESFALNSLDPSIRIFGPGATVAEDMEPEYIAVSHDSRTAWVTLQENNAIAELDIRNGVFTRVTGLGFKNHDDAANKLDASDRDGPGDEHALNIANWPILGMYMPDAIAAYRVRGRTYLVTANEGDAREYDHPTDGSFDFAELARISSLALNPVQFPAGAATTLLKSADGAGRLEVSRFFANTDGNAADVERLLTLGARSFSIWSADGAQVFDSGDQFEQIIAEADEQDAFGDLDPGGVGDVDFFNGANDENGSGWDTRSDAKGPEPEGVTVEHIWGRWYAFIALERVGGVMIYDVTEPSVPRFVQYVNRRDFSVDFDIDDPDGDILDLGAETLFVIPAGDSPTRQPLLVVCNEVSGTTTLFAIEKVK
ncbi:MAG: choice-of-anchor I family protein [Vicinamibacterales bacterium]